MTVDRLVVIPQNSIIYQAGPGCYTPGVTNSPLFNPVVHHERNAEVNGDGFGIAWYPDLSQSRLYKSVQPAWNDRNLKELSGALSSETIMCHIRAASPGSAISRENCHPFKFRNYTFMHNGGVATFPNVKREIRATLADDIYHMIEGQTDSETVFGVVLSMLDLNKEHHSGDELADALEKSISFLIRTSRKAGGGPSSLNLCLTDGVNTVVSRFRDSETEDPPSLYFATGDSFKISAADHFRISKKEPLTMCLVASEPLTFEEEDWTLLDRNTMVLIHSDANSPQIVTSVTTRSIKWDPLELGLSGTAVHRLTEKLPDEHVT